MEERSLFSSSNALHSNLKLLRHTTTLKARNLSLGDIHRLLKIEPRSNGSFTPLLQLKPLSIQEQQELFQIQHQFKAYWADGEISEGQVRLIAVAPLLRLAQFNQLPIRLKVEEDIARIYVEDEDTYITGRFDIVAANASDDRSNEQTNLWILIIESKNSEASESAGLPQLLAYAFSRLPFQERAKQSHATDTKILQFRLMLSDE